MNLLTQLFLPLLSDYVELAACGSSPFLYCFHLVFFYFSILLSYLDLISTILSLIIFYTILAWPFYSFLLANIQSKMFCFPTSNPDSWVSLKMILQPHMLMPKLNEAYITSFISLVSFSTLSSSLLFCCVHDWLIILPICSERNYNCNFLPPTLGYSGGSDGKESAWNARDLGSILGLGRFHGEGNSNPLQYSCLGNSMDRGAWWGYCPRGPKKLDTTEWLTHTHIHMTKFTDRCSREVIFLLKINSCIYTHDPISFLPRVLAIDWIFVSLLNSYVVELIFRMMVVVIAFGS